ncbi:hypothetical protein N7450_004743 [Penicillium hetheringtonii]|uniref:NAD(P)-binding protein n=1 Tax=Penicillium hetheringtonii TaxID=911720 RepID=A0AAD6DQS1_9EURO|nr:hypothetical protein N7450_004743 [Penicillium hetheringtonii]
MSPKVALITGGASGMGLAVATALSACFDWEVHILDINRDNGSQVAKSLARTTFHYADVTNYSVLGEAFQKCFQTHKRIDFVFANAGMIERVNFYEAHPISTSETVAPPPEPDLLSIDADLKGVILTTYLAQHYFRASPNQGVGSSIVMTASCGGLYPSFYSPLYSSAKFGVVGFMRSIAQHFKAGGIRANAICPGIVRTNLVDQNGWDAFPQHRFTDMEAVVRVVLQLADADEPAGQGLTDARGSHLPTESLFGLAVEISDSGVYFREQHEFCDDGMREVMAATVLKNQVGAILNQ